jgi:phenylpropionate dioxygenase-like ring-hydroxylating dioxygenase large terminal subunit
VPLLVTRDRDGGAHVFFNACRHKGSKLVETCEPLRASRLICPYHAWSYALDGRLVAVARAETFENLDKSQRGLVELASREAGGLIWAILDRQTEADFGSIDRGLIEDLDALELAQSFVHGRKSFDLKANWKLVLEPFLEGYHVQRLHASSVGPLFADVPTVLDRMGNSLRQISGKAEFSPDGLQQAGENIHKTVTHAYQAFPCTVIVTSPYYISVMILKPMAVDRTIVDYHMLTLNPADNERAQALYDRSLEMILKVFGNEDFRAAEICQAGLGSGALDDVVYSGLEFAIPMHYETLDRYLGVG